MASSEQVCYHSDAGTAPSLCPSSLCLPCVESNWHLTLQGTRWHSAPGGLVLLADVSHAGGLRLPLGLSFCVSVLL